MAPCPPRLFLAVILLSAPGCHQVFPFHSGAGDSHRLVEGQGAERPPDLSKGDGRPWTDAPLDWPPATREQGSDLPRADRPGQIVDADPDLAVGPCVASYVGGQWLGPKMAICQYGTYFNQCQAYAYCNTANGWSLCTASQYRSAPAGATSKAAAWIASCVRDGKENSAPTEATCSSCSNTLLSNPPYVIWECQGTWSLPLSDAFVGVHSYAQCRILGVYDVANAGKWNATGAGKMLDAAACCR